MLKLGKMKTGQDVYISEQSPNRHISVLGISGSGKSVRIREMINDIVNKNETVLVFDINGTDYLQCSKKIKCISAIRDGIPLEFLNAGQHSEDIEADKTYVMYILDLFSRVYKLGSMQSAVLRKAMYYAMQHNDEFQSEVAALRTGLEKQDDKQSITLAEKMWRFLNTDILRKGQALLTEGVVNVLSFESLEPSLQKILMELVLSVIWRRAQTEGRTENTLTIVIDEFQNFSLHNGSVLLQMLREARKYGINLILASQSISDCSKELTIALGQTATTLYFRQEPTAVEKVLKKIDPKKSIFWRKALMKLKVGESISCGEFCIRGKEISGPIIVKSEYRE